MVKSLKEYLEERFEIKLKNCFEEEMKKYPEISHLVDGEPIDYFSSENTSRIPRDTSEVTDAVMDCYISQGYDLVGGFSKIHSKSLVGTNYFFRNAFGLILVHVSHERKIPKIMGNVIPSPNGEISMGLLKEVDEIVGKVMETQ